MSHFLRWGSQELIEPSAVYREIDLDLVLLTAIASFETDGERLHSVCAVILYK